jgi:hypothetical protein
MVRSRETEIIVLHRTDAWHYPEKLHTASKNSFKMSDLDLERNETPRILNPWSRVLTEKLTAAQLFKNAKGSTSC